MKNQSDRLAASKGLSLSRDPWDVTGERIPETFPTRMAFFKAVELGIAITVAQFGILALLMMGKH